MVVDPSGRRPMRQKLDLADQLVELAFSLAHVPLSSGPVELTRKPVESESSATTQCRASDREPACAETSTVASGAAGLLVDVTG